MQAASTKKYVCCVASEPPLNETAELNQDVREGNLWDFLDAPKILPIVSCLNSSVHLPRCPFLIFVPFRY